MNEVTVLSPNFHTEVVPREWSSETRNNKFSSYINQKVNSAARQAAAAAGHFYFPMSLFKYELHFLNCFAANFLRRRIIPSSRLFPSACELWPACILIRERVCNFFLPTARDNFWKYSACSFVCCWRRISFIAPAEMHFLYLQALRCTQTDFGYSGNDLRIF